MRSSRRHIPAIRWVVYLFLANSPLLLYAQDTLPAMKPAEMYFFDGDTVVTAGQDSIVNAQASNIESKITHKSTSLKPDTPFKPNPKKAYLAAAIFPGFGQIYNRQYWKLPIVYGGFMGCAYAISWNNRTYQDYKNAYYSITIDAKNDPNAEHPEEWSDYWKVFVPGSIDPATRLRDATFHGNLKRGKDYFRRFRDLSIIISAGLYLICMADAYVDAQMFDFDVSPDLSFQVTPLYLPETLYHARSYGIHLCMTF